jgi:hypothetical protein
MEAPITSFGAFGLFEQAVAANDNVKVHKNRNSSFFIFPPIEYDYLLGYICTIYDSMVMENIYYKRLKIEAGLEEGLTLFILKLLD